MKVFDLMKRVKVDKIGIRLCKSEEDAKARSYDKTSIKYWGSLDDMPAEYASYRIVSSNVKGDTLFCWCVKDCLTVGDILEADNVPLEESHNYYKFFNYISEHDALHKIHDHAIPVLKTDGIAKYEVIDSVIYGDYADIYVFKDNIRSNIFEDTYDGNIEFREI